MTIKVIVELKAHPGRRDELRTVFEGMLTAQGPGLPGFLGSSRYEKLDDPDVLVEIADWASAEAREVHMTEAAATGTASAAPMVIVSSHARSATADCRRTAVVGRRAVRPLVCRR